MKALALEPLPPIVVPESTVRLVVPEVPVAEPDELFSSRVPLLTTHAPSYVLLAVKLTVPAPTLLMVFPVPLSDMTPAKVTIPPEAAVSFSV